MLKRNFFIDRLYEQLNVHPVVALLGPRQCGKTTLARQIGEGYSGAVHHFDLENPDDLLALTEPPGNSFRYSPTAAISILT